MKKIIIVALAVALAACSMPGNLRKNAAGPVTAVRAVPSAELPDFIDNGTRMLLMKGAALNAAYFDSRDSGPVYDFAGRTVDFKTLRASNAEFRRLLEKAGTPEELASAVKREFDVYRMTGQDGNGTVVFSSYYEPTLDASLVKTDKYPYPIYARPSDLVTASLGVFDEKYKGVNISGRVDGGGRLVPYYTRDQIDFQGALEGKGLELAWLGSRIDAMDLHVQGSGRLQLTDGRQIKALFAATNGLKFKGWQTYMKEKKMLGDIPVNLKNCTAYLSEHPEKLREVMSADARYGFFTLEDIKDPDEGPNGTYGLPLTGWRSVAVDNSLVPMGALGFLKVSEFPDVTEDGVLKGTKPDARFVFCQDTGGAIKGPGRIDFFAGNGIKAKTFAFRVWNKGEMYLLVLKKAYL